MIHLPKATMELVQLVNPLIPWGHPEVMPIQLDEILTGAVKHIYAPFPSKFTGRPRRLRFTQLRLLFSLPGWTHKDLNSTMASSPTTFFGTPVLVAGFANHSMWFPLGVKDELIEEASKYAPKRFRQVGTQSFFELVAPNETWSGTSTNHWALAATLATRRWFARSLVEFEKLHGGTRYDWYNQKWIPAGKKIGMGSTSHYHAAMTRGKDGSSRSVPEQAPFVTVDVS